jgi:VanZ family protein
MRSADRLARFLVLGAWMGLITYWSGQGNLPIDQPQVAYALLGFQHRIAHLIAFGLLGLLARWTFDGLPRAAVLAVALTSLFGAADEWHQSFTSGRHPGIDDWAVDTASAALALFLWARLRSTPLQAPIRALAPVAVVAVFAVGIGLAIPRTLSFPVDVERPSLRAIPTQVAHTALELARSTRAALRQARSAVG